MRTPLGVLSPSQLDKGENVLERIEEERTSGVCACWCQRVRASQQTVTEDVATRGVVIG
jgi:hypothetical protein